MKYTKPFEVQLTRDEIEIISNYLKTCDRTYMMVYEEIINNLVFKLKILLSK